MLAELDAHNRRGRPTERVDVRGHERERGDRQADGRGLHDLGSAAGSIFVRTYRLVAWIRVIYRAIAVCGRFVANSSSTCSTGIGIAVVSFVSRATHLRRVIACG